MKKIIDETTMNRMLTRITHEIVERNHSFDDTIIVGIRTRGMILGQRLVEKIKQLYQVDVAFEALDISNFRDDREKSGLPTGIESDLTEKTVILVDDVLYTGRSIRAALDAIVEHGRPRLIQLVTLIDRGHREFPIRPDFVGKNIPTSKSEQVRVNVKEIDAEDSVTLAQEHQE